MPTFIGLIEYTEDGIEEFEEMPDRLERARAAIEEMGGELKEYYITLGEYDAVAVAEYPDATSAATMSIQQAQHGTIRLQTMRAFDEAETAEIIEGLSG